MRRKWLPDFRIMAGSSDFDIVDDYHGKHAELYDGFRTDVGSEVSFYRSIIDPSTARIAELGCGTGSLSLPLAQSSRYYLALDVNEDMLDIFRKRLAEIDGPPSIEIRQGDFLDFPTKRDGLFDLVHIPYNSLVHLTSRSRQQRLFRRIARALKPGGRLVVDVWIPQFQVGKITHRISVINPNSEQWIVYSQELFRDPHTRIANMLLMPVDTPHRPIITAVSEYVFMRSELRGLFTQAGLKVARLPGDHPLVANEPRRCIYIGRRP